MKSSRWSQTIQNDIIAKILKAIKKQKTSNKGWQGNCIHMVFVHIPYFFVRPLATLTILLENRKLIEYIYSKNNNYLLIDRVYEDDKTLTLAKNHGFYTVKKNLKLP